MINERKDMETKVLKIFQILATLVGIIFLTGCKTVRKVETVETVRVDSIVSVDTVYMERTEVRFDTTYVYDSHSERYVMGKVDTLWNIRVDTLRVETINYIYKEHKNQATDSTASAKANIQKAAAADVRTVEKVVEEPVPLWKKACVVLALMIVAAIFYVAGNWGGKR